MTTKMTYQQIVALNLAKRKCEPGDMLTLTLRNEECAEGIYTQAKRTSDLFLLGFGFFAETIALHPDHLAILNRQGKSLDIVVSEAAATSLRDLVELADVPVRTPLVADGTLDLFTTVARYHFRRENCGDMAIDIVQYLLRTLKD